MKIKKTLCKIGQNVYSQNLFETRPPTKPPLFTQESDCPSLASLFLITAARSANIWRPHSSIFNNVENKTSKLSRVWATVALCLFLLRSSQAYRALFLYQINQTQNCNKCWLKIWNNTSKLKSTDLA